MEAKTTRATSTTRSTAASLAAGWTPPSCHRSARALCRPPDGVAVGLAGSALGDRGQDEDASGQRGVGEDAAKPVAHLAGRQLPVGVHERDCRTDGLTPLRVG